MADTEGMAAGQRDRHEGPLMNEAIQCGVRIVAMVITIRWLSSSPSASQAAGRRDWRSFGAFRRSWSRCSRSVRLSHDDLHAVGLGLPAVYGIEFLSHDAGHLLEVMLGGSPNQTLGTFHARAHPDRGRSGDASAWRCFPRRNGRGCETGPKPHPPSSDTSLSPNMKGFFSVAHVGRCRCSVLVVMYARSPRGSGRDACPVRRGIRRYMAQVPLLRGRLERNCFST